MALAELVVGRIHFKRLGLVFAGGDIEVVRHLRGVRMDGDMGVWNNIRMVG